MQKIIPTKMLINVKEVCTMVQASDEPIIVTKNGFASMIMMSVEVYERYEKAMNELQKIKNKEK